MTEARIVITLLSGDVLTGQWVEHTSDELVHVIDNTGIVLADNDGNFSIKIDEHTTIFVACRRINFIQLQTR